MGLFLSLVDLCPECAKDKIHTGTFSRFFFFIENWNVVFGQDSNHQFIWHSYNLSAQNLKRYVPPVQCICVCVCVLPLCPSPPLLTPKGTFTFLTHSQTSSQPKHPLHPGLRWPLLPLQTILLHTYTFREHCFRSRRLHVLRHLLSTFPAVAHSLPVRQNNSPTSQWHAHRTEITQGRVR